MADCVATPSGTGSDRIWLQEPRWYTWGDMDPPHTLRKWWQCTTSWALDHVPRIIPRPSISDFVSQLWTGKESLGMRLPFPCPSPDLYPEAVKSWWRPGNEQNSPSNLQHYQQPHIQPTARHPEGMYITSCCHRLSQVHRLEQAKQYKPATTLMYLSWCECMHRVGWAWRVYRDTNTQKLLSLSYTQPSLIPRWPSPKIWIMDSL